MATQSLMAVVTRSAHDLLIGGGRPDRAGPGHWPAAGKGKPRTIAKGVAGATFAHAGKSPGQIPREIKSRGPVRDTGSGCPGAPRATPAVAPRAEPTRRRETVSR